MGGCMRRSVITSFAVVALGWALCGMLAADQPTLPPSAAQKTPRASNMALVGYNDLQARSAYQPIVQKQGNRWIAYVGHHGGGKIKPQTRKKEPDRAAIIDVTATKKPQNLGRTSAQPQ